MLLVVFGFVRFVHMMATIEDQIRRAIDPLASRFPKITDEEEKARVMNEFHSKLPLDECRSYNQ